MTTDSLQALPLPLTGSTRLFAIVGDPIDQAGSPALFNAAFRALAQPAVLVPMHVAPLDLPALINAFRATRNWDGLVVTVPHKVAVAGLVDELDENALRLGAVNAIRKTGDGRLIGGNFDGEGFMQGLLARGYAVNGRNVLVIGAGGAGRAIAHAVADAVPASLTISDIDKVRALELAASVTSSHPNVQVRSEGANARGQDVIINCSPPNPASPFSLPVELDDAPPNSLVADIVLKPAWTPLLDAARVQGLATHEGIHMLTGQVETVISFFGQHDEQNKSKRS